MEATSFGYSTKNIPLPSEKDYSKNLIEKTEQLCKRMRWKAHFFLNPVTTSNKKETYGFNSKRTPPQIPELVNFENRLHEMIEKIKFKDVNCGFQKKLSSDIKNIRKSNTLFVPADKTTNFYKMDSTSYNQLLQKNITKTYKKISPDTVSSLENQAKSIAGRLNLADRINTTAERDAFITLKDHKTNFENNPTCRLINPSKSEIGKISKKILDRINTKVTEAASLNQWKNTASVLTWFNNISNKNEYSFIAFDVVDFYPSISIELLNAALDFASNYDNITDEERQIIIHAKKSCLYNSGNHWGKKASSNLFDVTMGSFDGAESCELVGSFLLHHITTRHGNNFGLYRDDGLGIIKATPREVELIKKDLCAIFNNHGLKITIEANKKIVNFLDVTLNLSNEKYQPYSKPNNTPLYVHKRSNHPPRILDNIPLSINKRLTEISSDEESFRHAVPLYQKALDKSGYKHRLEFKHPLNQTANQNRNRKRNIIWYNPPYSKNVSTNVGQSFLKILDEEFPTGHTLHKIFNRNTVKISYSCMSNIKQTIDGHNKSNLSQTQNADSQNTCNCRKKCECPMSGKCLVESVVYQATVTAKDNKPLQTYVGLTENSFKTRFTNHKASFNSYKKRNSTELSKYIWDLKSSNVEFTINWKILKKARPYNRASNRCNLCLWEKYYIICKPSMATLNKRNELVSSCRHAKKFLLINF